MKSYRLQEVFSGNEWEASGPQSPATALQGHTRHFDKCIIKVLQDLIRPCQQIQRFQRPPGGASLEASVFLGNRVYLKVAGVVWSRPAPTIYLS